jgi:hypothetical protein
LGGHYGIAGLEVDIIFNLRHYGTHQFTPALGRLMVKKLPVSAD